MDAVQQAADEALRRLLQEAALQDVESEWQEEACEAGEAPAATAEQALPPQVAARLYATRLRAAATEVASLQAAMRDKDQRLGSLEQDVLALRAAAAAGAKERKALEAKTERQQRAAEAAAEQLKQREALLHQLESEQRASVQERRQAEVEAKARDARLNHALEEAARYRRLLEEAREAQRAMQGVPREEHSRVLAENRTLQGQKAELVTAFSKAMKLVGVLDLQKQHLQTAQLVHGAETTMAAR